MNINGHRTRISMDASSYDEVCIKRGAHDEVPGGLGGLAYPCPVTDEEYEQQRRQQQQPDEQDPRR